MKKGILALGDFFKVLDENDVTEFISRIDIYSQLSEHIKAGVHEKTSVLEKTQLNMFLASKAFSGNNEPIVLRAGQTFIQNDVESYAIPRTEIPKADWFNQLFEDMEADNDNGGSSMDEFALQDMFGFTDTEEFEAECLEI